MSTTSVTANQRKKARQISEEFVATLRQNNKQPKGDLKVSEADYERLAKTLTAKLLQVME